MLLEPVMSIGLRVKRRNLYKTVFPVKSFRFQKNAIGLKPKLGKSYLLREFLEFLQHRLRNAKATRRWSSPHPLDLTVLLTDAL